MRKLITSITLAAAVLAGCSENHQKNLQKLEGFIQQDTSMIHNLRVICKEYPEDCREAGRMQGRRNTFIMNSTRLGQRLPLWRCRCQTGMAVKAKLL